MCELFAMSSLSPTNVRFSLETFSRHGGLEGPHKDGWGIAYYEDDDVRLVKEKHPAFDSPCVRFIQDHPFSATTVLSHIRRATQGRLGMNNCQPFARELGGRMHVFAHNGDLERSALAAEMRPGRFRAVGDTDSEYAFCALLGQLSALWMKASPPPLEARLGVVARFAAAIRPLGPANFLYSDGDALFIHGHRRFHGDGGGATPPGLYTLCRRCATQPGEIDAAGLSIALGSEQSVVLAASVPLTAEHGWRALEEGELVVAQHGRIVARARARAPSLRALQPEALLR
jgi:predicted glutamine amidotransferase